MSLTIRREHAGGAAPTTTAGITLASATTISLVNGTGWPTGAVGPFYITLARGTTNEERVLCDDRVGNVLTVAASGRGTDGTVAREHQAATVVEHTWSTLEADEANAHSSSLAGHGVDVVVGLDEVQTLDNKTLGSPIINAPDINGGTVDAATITGGTLAGTIAGSPTLSGAPVIANFTGMAHDHGDADDGGNIPEASVTNLVADLAAKLDDSQLGAANGVAPLNASSDVPFANLDTGTGASQVAVGNHGHLPFTVFSGVRAERTATQGIGNAASETVGWTAADTYDTDNYHSTPTNEFVIPATGHYRIDTEVVFEGHATGRRVVDIRLNDASGDATLGNSIGKTNNSPGHAIEYHCVATARRLFTAGDMIKIFVFQNSGGALNLLGNTAPDNSTCWVTIDRIPS